MKRITIIVAVLCVLAFAAGAGAFAVEKFVNVQRGSTAVFPSSLWSCSNGGKTVTCISGDAWPWVELGVAKNGSLAVRVHVLKDPQGGRLTRAYSKGNPVYTFQALP